MKYLHNLCYETGIYSLLRKQILALISCILGKLFFQESIYLSFQGNVHGGSSRLNNGHDRNMGEGNSSRMARVEQQLALDEALDRELQESENQLADTSFGEVTRIEASSKYLFQATSYPFQIIFSTGINFITSLPVFLRH